jgi:hypothetical protein
LPSKTADITVTTDSEGRFEIQHVPEGTIQIQITHPQFISLQQHDVVVSDGGKTETGVLRLSVGAGVKGTVFGADGSPSANAEVRIQYKSAPGMQFKGFMNKTVRCDAQGKYVIRNLPAGDYMIHAVAGSVGDPFTKMALGQKSRKEITLIDNSDQEVDIFLTN